MRTQRAAPPTSYFESNKAASKGAAFFMPSHNNNKGDPMAYDHHTLWRRIEAHSPGYPDASLGFVQRLARENGWTEAYAARVLLEYKRFVYLAATLQHPVTPSDQVDQAWHLHLTYTRDYWEVFCPQVLGQPLHHDPTRGGGAERTKFFDWYERTLAAYREVFGNPPQDIWPGPERRFVQRFERRELADRPAARPGLRWIGALVGTLGVAGAAWGTQDTARSNLIWLLLGLGAVAVGLIGFALKQPASRRTDGGGGCGGGCTVGSGSKPCSILDDLSGDSGCSGGGCGGGGCGGGCGG
jgi:hypothetical protein